MSGPLQKPVFRSVSELRDALLASYPDAHDVKAPVVMFRDGRDWDSYPAWRWARDLVRKRSDWWPALGVALQHAATDGGPYARTALADLHQQYPDESIALLRWTEPIARVYPDAVATFRQAHRRLAEIVGEQLMAWDATNDEAIVIDIYDGPGETPVSTRIRTAAELESALARCAKVGMPCPPEEGPWTWLVTASLSHPWLGPMIPGACPKFGSGTDKEVRAVLDWLVDQHDLWRYIDLLETWARTPPRWWDEPAKKRKPRGWTTAPRWNGYATLGDVATRHLQLARAQVDSRPLMDLEPMGK